MPDEPEALTGEMQVTDWGLRRRAVRLASAVLVAASALAGAPAAECVRTSDGRELAGAVLALDSSAATVQQQDGRHTVPLKDIAAIVLSGAPVADLMARKGQGVARLTDGGSLAVREATVGDGKLHAVTDCVGRVALPLERVAVLLRPLASETPAQLEGELRQAGVAPGREDTLVVRAPGGKWIPMNGVLSSLADGQAAFAYEGAETAMKDDSIAIVVFAASSRAGAARAGGGQVICADGSRIAFRTIRLDGKEAAPESEALGALRLRRDGVAEIRLRREDSVFLSDLPPSQVRQTPFFDDEFSWQKDRSVSGQPLSLGGVTCEKGLGLHAHCRLVFGLRGQFQRLTALAGIDDELRAGMALLSLVADGKPLVDRLLLDRSMPPQKLSLDLRGVQSLEVMVDFAERTFGAGARVSLCDPVLTK